MLYSDPYITSKRVLLAIVGNFNLSNIMICKLFICYNL